VRLLEVFSYMFPARGSPNLPVPPRIPEDDIIVVVERVVARWSDSVRR
jgi:hypothetical protein